MARVSLRLSEGEADLGATTIRLQRDSEGVLQLGGGEGPKLRALRFGERGRIVRQALTARDGVAEVVGGVTSAALVDPGKAGVDPEAVSVLALHLAGAGSGGPGFSESMALLARSLGWSPEQLADAEASEVDELASHLSDALLSARQESSQWQSIVFQGGDAGGKRAAALRDLQRELARDLLERGQSLPDLAALGAPAARAGGEPKPAQGADSKPTEQAPQSRSGQGSADENSADEGSGQAKSPQIESKDPEHETEAKLETATAQSGEAPQGKAPAAAPAPEGQDRHALEGGEDRSSAPSNGPPEKPTTIPPDSPGKSSGEHRATPPHDLTDLRPEPRLDRFLSPQLGGGASERGDLEPLKIRGEAGADMRELLRGFDDAHDARRRVSGKAPEAVSSASKDPSALAGSDLAPKAGPALEADDLEELADFIANELHRAADQRRVDP